MKKILLLVMAVAAIISSGYANPTDVNEKKSSGFDVSRLVYGGQVGFGFGSDDYWAVSISPQIGYRLTNRLIVGAGVSYAYSQENFNFIYSYKRKQNQFGFNVFADFYFAKRFFVSARPEIFYQRQNWKVRDSQGNQLKVSESGFIPATLLGVGVHFKPITLSLYYDVIQDDLSPYGNSVFLSIGFRF